VSGRKAFARVWVVVLGLGLAACGGSSSKPGGSAGSGGHAGGGGHAGSAAGNGGGGGASGSAGGAAGGATDGGGTGGESTNDGGSGGEPADANVEKCSPIRICQTGGGTYCGKFPDGCGGLMDCGNDCPAGQTCGTDHLCADPNCTPMPCMGTGYQWCGVIGDGCNHALNCGACTAPKTCGMNHACQ
jgi:hypothetical protein